MKILFLCTDPGVPIFGRKGCSTHVRETCLTMKELGHDVRLICSNTEGDDAGREELELVRVEPYRSRKLGFDLRHILLDRRIEKAAERLIDRWQPEAIYERYSLYSRAGTRLAERKRLPQLLEVNAFITQEQGDRIKLMPLARLYERRIIVKARHVVVVSEPLQRQVGKLRNGEETISNIPMGVNLDRFNPSVDASDLRRSLGLENKFVLGFTGTLSGWHGIALLYDLARALRTRGIEDFAIIVVGGDEKKVARHRQKVEEEKLRDVLHFLGPVPHTEVGRYIRLMDVAMVPDTTYWSSPAKLFEYQACGVPILAPRYPAVMSVIDHGVEGLIFEPRNIEEMADHAYALFRDRDARVRIGMRGRRRAEKLHSWTSRGQPIIRIFEKQQRELGRL